MKIDITKVAKLANLDLSEEEKNKFETQLSSILDYFKKLQELDTKNVEETSQVTGLENVVRQDKSELSLTQEDVLKNTEQKQNGLFKVKAILES